MPSESTTKYSDAYATLKEVSEKLQTVTDLDVDELVADVAKATKAYQVCKGRISAATKELDTAFSQVNELTSDAVNPVGPTGDLHLVKEKTADEADTDDIPF